MKFNGNGNREAITLFIGDVIFWVIALWLTLLVRYGDVPGKDIFESHILPFCIIFVVWTVIFFISNLYSRQTILSRSRLPSIIFNAQVVNSVIAVLFFYFIPYFTITPKVNLFIDLVFSFLLVLFWRIYAVNYFLQGKKVFAVILGDGKEIDDIKRIITENPRTRMRVEHFPLTEDSLKIIQKKSPDIVILNLRSEEVKRFSMLLHSFLFSHITFVSIHDIYESIFGRVALSHLDDNWFLENINAHYQFVYSWVKRGMDIVISLILGILSLFIYPFVCIAIRLEDKGPFFITQERIGEGGHLITITKFRSMTGGDVGNEVLKSKQNVTRVGSFLRRTRIDELPQLWNVLKGDLSLIGPRPELPALREHYKKEIPYYDLRHLIRPGLSGWAQIYHDNHPHHERDVEATKEKLSYDFYYIKNRGIITDFKIALKTLRTLFSRSGA